MGLKHVVEKWGQGFIETLSVFKRHIFEVFGMIMRLPAMKSEGCSIPDEVRINWNWKNHWLNWDLKNTGLSSRVIRHNDIEGFLLKALENDHKVCLVCPRVSWQGKNDKIKKLYYWITSVSWLSDFFASHQSWKLKIVLKFLEFLSMNMGRKNSRGLQNWPEVLDVLVTVINLVHS